MIGGSCWGLRAGDRGSCWGLRAGDRGSCWGLRVGDRGSCWGLRAGDRGSCWGLRAGDRGSCWGLRAGDRGSCWGLRAGDRESHVTTCCHGNAPLQGTPALHPLFDPTGSRLPGSLPGYPSSPSLYRPEPPGRYRRTKWYRVIC